MWFGICFPISVLFHALRLPLSSTLLHIMYFHLHSCSFIYWWTPHIVTYELSDVVRDAWSTYSFFSRTEIWSLIQMSNLGAENSLATHQWIAVCIMKDFKGSSHRGQYHGNYAVERIWDGARSSVVLTISAFYSCWSYSFIIWLRWPFVY